ncbi:PtdIns3K complex subunit Atg38 [Schizosaccharomyces osmophilus]|uniref:PtdIns3K complex subunit Atg38 n=1 Tax=Schizosaccharomyces osmophilus TaxID=2545709 RepID=A0AAE9WC41_9SCHI|nr:PtdIns3K complex subunit Atg38 [Schizosaccharomyces osmophilus]WBW72879.1 PtdIns3K complex subunit Atg38 [Schizosaccharomyces osmophilus]
MVRYSLKKAHEYARDGEIQEVSGELAQAILCYSLAKSEYQGISDVTMRHLTKICVSYQIEELTKRIEELKIIAPTKQSTPSSAMASMSVSTRLSPMYTSALTTRFTSNSVVLPTENSPLQSKQLIQEKPYDDKDDDPFTIYPKFQSQVNKLAPSYGLAVAYSIVPMDDEQSSPSMFSSDESFTIIEGDDFTIEKPEHEESLPTEEYEDESKESTHSVGMHPKITTPTNLHELTNEKIQNPAAYDSTTESEGQTDEPIRPKKELSRQKTETEMDFANRKSKGKERYKEETVNSSTTSSVGEILDSQEDMTQTSKEEPREAFPDARKELEASSTPSAGNKAKPERPKRPERKRSRFLMPFFRTFSGRKKKLEEEKSPESSIESSTAQLTMNSQVKIEQLETQIATLQRQLEHFQVQNP